MYSNNTGTRIMLTGISDINMHNKLIKYITVRTGIDMQEYSYIDSDNGIHYFKHKINGTIKAFKVNASELVKV